MMRLRFARYSVLFATAIVVAGCSRESRQSHDDSQPLPEKIVMEALTAFPDESPTDWASYVDQLSIVTVLSESAIEPSAQVRERGEGYVGRTVRLRVDETIWSTDGVMSQVGEIDLVAVGWLLKGDKYIRTAYLDSPRIEVGGRYILPLIRDGERWGVLTPSAVAAAENDPIATADVRSNGNNRLAEEISGLDGPQVRGMLAAAPRVPLIEKHRHLPALQRAEAVRLELAGPPPDFVLPAMAGRRGRR